MEASLTHEEFSKNLNTKFQVQNEENTPAELELIETLDRWGIRTLADLAALPELGFIARFGEQGERMLRLAQGETHRSLRVMAPSESYQRRIELEHPQRLLEPLLFVIASLLNELMQGLSFNRVTLRLNGDPRTLWS